MFLCLKNCKANSVSFREFCVKTKICPYILMSKKLQSKFCVSLCIPCANKFPRPLRSLRETNYQSIEFSPLKQAFVI